MADPASRAKVAVHASSFFMGSFPGWMSGLRSEAEAVAQAVPPRAGHRVRHGEAAAARERDPRDVGEHVETGAVAVHGLREDLAEEVAADDAVAAVALGEVGVRAEPAELRHAAEGDGAVAGPGVVDAHAPEL